MLPDTDWQAISAVVQGLSAVAIAVLTFFLVRTTGSYRDETKRMADLMARSRSEEAAERLTRSLVEFNRQLHDPTSAYLDISSAIGADGEALIDAELRDRVRRFERIALVALNKGRGEDDEAFSIRLRLSKAVGLLRSDLSAYRRGEDLPEWWLPPDNFEGIQRWLLDE